MTPNKEIISTAIYEIDGEVHTHKLDGFIPGGVKVKIDLHNNCYYGISFTPFKQTKVHYLTGDEI